MDESARPTRYRHTSADAEALLAAGESAGIEYKRDAKAVESATLAALSNWVALDPSREVAHLLVGVEEVTDRATGLTFGVVYGLSKGLEKSVARLLDVSSCTYPIPVDLFIVEEAVDEEHPFLRVEVRPTMAPHHDGQGRRQTRQGRSTRAMTDDELLKVYLDREASTFATRFHHTTTELHEAVDAVGAQVNQIAGAIERNIGGPLEELTATTHQAVFAAEAILDRIRDYALCSDLRMYAWARRRRHEEAGSDPAVIEYMKAVEQGKSQFAEDAFEELQEFLNELTTEHAPALPETEKAVPEFLREHLDRTDAAVAELGVPDDVLASIAAVGMVVTSWRNLLEPWHYLFTDAQMSWMSFIATRDIIPHMNPATNQPDFAAIEQILCDPDRLVLPGVPAHDAIGPAWPSIARRIAAEVRQCEKAGYTARALASWGGTAGSRWWGRPDWEDQARATADHLGLTQYRTRQLIREPWKLPFEMWERAIEFQKEVHCQR
ncbi:hypothetical protein GCM10027447_35640 [Glycomyces halotolerans]